MELNYEKTALQEYMDIMRSIGESVKRVKDDGSMQYDSCKQKYTRLHTEVEQECRRAYNAVKEAESMQREADIEYDYAIGLMNDAEDSDEIEAAQQRLSEAQELQEEAAEAMEKSTAEYAKAQANMNSLTNIWEKFQPRLDSAAHRLEDGLFAFSMVMGNCNRDLGEYIEKMDKAQAALYEELDVSSYSAENGKDISSVKNNHQNIADSVQAIQTEAGNTIKIFSEAGTASVTINIDGQNYSFPNTKSGIAKAYRTAVKSGDSELILRTREMFLAGGIDSDIAVLDNQ